jgi:hypothetical protein
MILLLNGWMTLYFRGWTSKLNIIIPILIVEFASSIFFEIIGFYYDLPYNKIQLYNIKDIFENIIIAFIALISIYKYYLPLRNKCKYLYIINSTFAKVYGTKKKKLIVYDIFILICSIMSIYSNFIEYSIIYKYIENDILYLIKQISFESISSIIFMLVILPSKLPYLFKEETDLMDLGYFFTDLSDEKKIIDINEKNINNFEKKIKNNIEAPIILVNPFYKVDNGFIEFHTGKASI